MTAEELKVELEDEGFEDVYCRYTDSCYQIKITKHGKTLYYAFSSLQPNPKPYILRKFNELHTGKLTYETGAGS